MAKRKLTPEQVREIRKIENDRLFHAAMAHEYRRSETAKKFGVSYSVITTIADGSAYADVD